MRPKPRALTNDEKLELRRSLERKEAELLASVDAQSANISPVSPDASLGRLTRLDAIQQQQMAKAQLANAQQALTRVQQILTSWDDAIAGLCRNCDDPIGYERLMRVPESLICMECLEDAG